MSARDWALLGVIVLIAAGLRLGGLGSPPRLVLDEYWYARDGCFYWQGSQTRCDLATLVAPDRDVRGMLADYGELTPEHPPLAKLLIGAPVRMFGFGPRVWRLAPVLAGLLTIALLFAFAKRLTASTAAAAGAAALLAVDYPHFIHSRLAMLDVFVGACARRHLLLLARSCADRGPQPRALGAPPLAPGGRSRRGSSRRIQALRRRRRRWGPRPGHRVGGRGTAVDAGPGLG